MDNLNPLDLGLRWMHIFAAITAVGGTFFARLALLPAMEESLTPESRKTLHTAIRRRWSKLVAASISFLLVSGLVNYLTRIIPNYELPKFYHPLFGVKFLLALGIFFIASVLSGRSAMADRFRQNARKWLTINAVLAVLVVLISGVLKTAEKSKKPAESPAAAFAASTSEPKGAGIVARRPPVAHFSLLPCRPLFRIE